MLETVETVDLREDNAERESVLENLRSNPYTALGARFAATTDHGVITGTVLAVEVRNAPEGYSSVEEGVYVVLNAYIVRVEYNGRVHVQRR